MKVVDTNRLCTFFRMSGSLLDYEHSQLHDVAESRVLSKVLVNPGQSLPSTAQCIDLTEQHVQPKTD